MDILTKIIHLKKESSQISYSENLDDSKELEFYDLEIINLIFNYCISKGYNIENFPKEYIDYIENNDDDFNDFLSFDVKYYYVLKVSLIHENKTLENQVKVAQFSLATSDQFRDESGGKHTITDWHTIIMWRGLADLAQKFLHKGSLVYLEGKLKTRSYENKEGLKVNVSEVVVDHFLMLDKK